MNFIFQPSQLECPTFHDDPKLARRISTIRQLEASARDYLRSQPLLAPLGPDPLVQHLLSAKGFARHDVAVVRFAGKGRLATAICAHTRIWRDPAARADLIEVKADAKRLRTSCILVPQRWLRGSKRGQTAKVLARSRHVRFTDPQLTAVLDHVRHDRITTVLACAAAIPDHEDPFGAVLAMCCMGILDLDRSTPVTGRSWVATQL